MSKLVSPGQRVLFAAAGTAGHIQPAIAVANVLAAKRPDLIIEFVGTPASLETDLVPAAGFKLNIVTKAAFPRRLNLSAIKWPLKFLRSISQMNKIAKRSDLVIGFGGYISASAYLSAWLYRRPYFVHEANLTFGLANRFGAKFANASFLTFPDQLAKDQIPRSEVVGLPLSNSVVAAAESAQSHSICKESLAREYGLDPLRPILVVVGGSLGAGKFNEVIAATKSNLLGIGVQIIHIVGKRNELPTSLPGYIPLTYLSNESMPKLYQGADLLITRAGAGTCMELAALGAFAILVPLAIGNGEQSQNAKFLVDAGAGIMIENGALTAQLLLENFETWISAAAAMRSDQKKISVSLHAAEIISDRLISTLDALGNRL